MKLHLPVAYIGAITNLMLTMGSGDDASQVSAQAVKLEAEVPPDLLTQLREGLPEKFFDIPEKGLPVPSIPELETMSWKTEYEKGKLVFDLSSCGDLDFEVDEDELTFLGVDVKAIQFEPLGTGMVRFSCNAIIRTDKEGRGKLTALLKHTVAATFTKLTQKPLAEPKTPKDDAANPNQGTLPIDSSKVTTDHEPIVPLVH